MKSNYFDSIKQLKLYIIDVIIGFYFCWLNFTTKKKEFEKDNLK